VVVDKGSSDAYSQKLNNDDLREQLADYRSLVVTPKITETFLIQIAFQNTQQKETNLTVHSKLKYNHENDNYIQYNTAMNLMLTVFQIQATVMIYSHPCHDFSK
jgi:hypothetical protein